MDWLDCLAVQETIKGLLQHHSSKASVFWHSAFPIVQLSHPYMTTGKTIGLTIWTFVGKVLSLLFFFFNLFILIGGYLLYNIVVVLPYIDMNQPRVHMCSPSWTPLPPSSRHIPQGHPSAPAPSTLSHASNLDWWSISNMIIYMFQCYSLKSSSPRLLPQSSKLFYTSVSLLLSSI